MRLLSGVLLSLGALLSPASARSLRDASQLTPAAIPVAHGGDHAYFRPAATDVSGFPNNDKPYHRSPCPCINALANHGYIARDGKNLTPAVLKTALMDVFHLSDGLVQPLLDHLPETLTLADLSFHNFIEHDASMVHDDLYFGDDPSRVNATLVGQLLARATTDGMLTKRVIAYWRREREIQCAKTNPQCDVGLKRQAIAYGEAAAFVVAMGDYDLESISVAHAKSFLLYERIPDDFVRSRTEISVAKGISVAAKIRAMSSFPWELLSAFSRWLGSVVDQKWDAAFPLSVAL